MTFDRSEQLAPKDQPDQPGNPWGDMRSAPGHNKVPSHSDIEGDTSIRYPFTQRYTALPILSDAELNQADPRAAQASTTRKTIDNLENDIVSLATPYGINEYQIRYAFTELITNATQYGAQGPDDHTCGQIDVAWTVDATPGERSIRLTVGNPCLQLFDPSHYARMRGEDFYSIEEDSNGHLFTISMLSLVKPGTSICYVWDLPSGERITCNMRKLDDTPEEGQQERDGESLANQEIMCPVELCVTKSDALNRLMPYSEAEFMTDISQGLSTKYLAISLILPEKQS